MANNNPINNPMDNPNPYGKISGKGLGHSSYNFDKQEEILNSIESFSNSFKRLFTDAKYDFEKMYELRSEYKELFDKIYGSIKGLDENVRKIIDANSYLEVAIDGYRKSILRMQPRLNAAVDSFSKEFGLSMSTAKETVAKMAVSGSLVNWDNYISALSKFEKISELYNIEGEQKKRLKEEIMYEPSKQLVGTKELAQVLKSNEVATKKLAEINEKIGIKNYENTNKTINSFDGFKKVQDKHSGVITNTIGKIFAKSGNFGELVARESVYSAKDKGLIKQTLSGTGSFLFFQAFEGIASILKLGSLSNLGITIGLITNFVKTFIESANESRKMAAMASMFGDTGTFEAMRIPLDKATGYSMGMMVSGMHYKIIDSIIENMLRSGYYQKKISISESQYSGAIADVVKEMPSMVKVGFSVGMSLDEASKASTEFVAAMGADRGVAKEFKRLIMFSKEAGMTFSNLTSKIGDFTTLSAKYSKEAALEAMQGASIIIGKMSDSVGKSLMASSLGRLLGMGLNYQYGLTYAMSGVPDLGRLAMGKSGALGILINDINILKNQLMGNMGINKDFYKGEIKTRKDLERLLAISNVYSQFLGEEVGKKYFSDPSFRREFENAFTSKSIDDIERLRRLADAESAEARAEKQMVQQTNLLDLIANSTATIVRMLTRLPFISGSVASSNYYGQQPVKI